MHGIEAGIEPTSIELSTSETGFMLLTPGGENARPELDPETAAVGVRVHRRSLALPAILTFRERTVAFETHEVPGARSLSTHRRSAFGPRWFQPHVALPKPGSAIGENLGTVGIQFRKVVDSLTFDRFEIKVTTRERIASRHRVSRRRRPRARGAG